MKLWYPTIIQELQQIMPNINSWTNILEKFYLKQDSLWQRLTLNFFNFTSFGVIYPSFLTSAVDAH